MGRPEKYPEVFVVKRLSCTAARPWHGLCDEARRREGRTRSAERYRREVPCSDGNLALRI